VVGSVHFLTLLSGFRRNFAFSLPIAASAVDFAVGTSIASGHAAETKSP
jgi:hypothetical protein